MWNKTGILTNAKRTVGIISLTIAFATSISAQSPDTAIQRAPSNPARPFVVMPAQSLADLERKLQPENKAEDLIGGKGMQTRVAVQHDKSRPTAAAELHDASDDVYYVLEGSATLTLGGRLEAPKEIEPGEWRSPSIVGGQTFQITKGDLIVVPRGTPHQRTGKDFSMILIKIYAEPLPGPPPQIPARPAIPPPAPAPSKP
ncbi:MAG TPA: cupin domain-containing protein [Pyrinomonadaceae bacterium]|jgi:mannose-6-phosphate isomerase-like protein (cupin superfamily)|nr:cupin domain-containing protein [Pyrinomonadaceae bacterium]